MPTREYHIRVTQDHIRRGERGSLMRCPIGLALEDAGGAGVMFPLSSLPEVAQNFVRDFDEGRRVEPFQFIMEVWS